MAQLGISSDRLLPFSIFFLVLLEVLCHAVMINAWGASFTSVIYLMTGLAIPLLAFQYLSSRKTSHEASNLSQVRFYSIIVFLTVAFMLIHYAKLLFAANPLDYRIADMLPVIEIMSERFINGEEVYAPIPEIWEGIQPIYLPAFWLPYSLAKFIEVDLRWISVLFMICTLMVIFLKIYCENVDSRAPILFTLISTVLLCISILILDERMILRTQEPVAFFYYVLLGYGLMKEKWQLTGVAIALCLLSRFMIAPWVVVFLIFLILQQRIRETFQISIPSMALIIFLLLLTGAADRINLFLTLDDHYLYAIQSDPEKYIPTISSNLGIAKFFQMEDLNVLHLALKISSFVIPFTAFLLYLIYRPSVRIGLYSLLVLKLSLVFFLNLLIIPYDYLFYTSTFCSILILTCLNNTSGIKFLPERKFD